MTARMRTDSSNIFPPASPLVEMRDVDTRGQLDHQVLGDPLGDPEFIETLIAANAFGTPAKYSAGVPATPM